LFALAASGGNQSHVELNFNEQGTAAASISEEKERENNDGASIVW
jgi:hypothetical protein